MLSCEKCGMEIPMDAKFCVKCGASIHKEDNSDEKPKLRPKPKKRKIRPLLLILSFMLILGILAGGWSGYYIAKNGWEVVPFAKKLSFLSIVKFDKEKIETYSDPIHEEAPEDMKKEASPMEEDTKDIDDDFLFEESLSTETISEVDQGQIAIGDWVGAHSKGNIIIRFSDAGVASGIFEEVVENSSFLETESFREDFTLHGNLLKIGDQDFGEFDFVKEELDVFLEDRRVTLRKNLIPSMSLDGLWVQADNDDFFIEFQEDLHGRTTIFTDESSDFMEYQYSYDLEIGVLTLTPTSADGMDTKILYAQIIGDYLLIYFEEDVKEVILLKKQLEVINHENAEVLHPV